MRRIIIITAVFVALLGACGASGGERATTPTTPTSTTAPSTTTTARPTTTTLPPPVTMPNGDPVIDGYPKLVETSSVDSRVANWAKSPQLVALAPGVYTDYNPNIPDLTKYMDEPNYGDCAMRAEYFPDTGGACWTGVR